MKNQKSTLLSFVLTILLCFSPFMLAFAAETPPEDYTPIYTAEDLSNIKNNLSGNYIMMNDIDLSAYENWEPIGTYEAPFTGIFDGNSYLIRNLKIERISDDTSIIYCGLFGKISEASIKNINFYNAQISSKYIANETAKVFSGIVAGYGFLSEITNCAVSGSVRSEGFSKTSLGGIVGTCGTQSAVNYCSNYADIKASASAKSVSVHVGGITGNSTHTVIKCANFGNVTVNGENVNENAEIKIGGIVGSHSEMWVGAAYNTGKISIDFVVPDTCIGGISGCTLMGLNLYNRGLIETPETFSGCVGAISGDVCAPSGAFGVSYSIESSYYLTTDLPAGYADGIHPDKLSESLYSNYYNGVTELTDEEMKNQDSFSGFDFQEVWVMEENEYPVLLDQPTLTISESITLEKSETFALTSFKKWNSTDKKTITINENGELVALSAGTATITLEIVDGYTVEYIVTVTDSSPQPEPDPQPKPNNTLNWFVNFIEKVINTVFIFFRNLAI